MNKRQELQAQWLLRPRPSWWMSPECARIWAISLAVLIVVALTFLLAVGVMYKIDHQVMHLWTPSFP